LDVRQGREHGGIDVATEKEGRTLGVQKLSRTHLARGRNKGTYEVVHFGRKKGKERIESKQQRMGKRES